jgi:hypothetical protein
VELTQIFPAFFFLEDQKCIRGKKEEGGRRKEEGGRRKEEGGRREEEGGRRKKRREEPKTY